MAVFDPFSSNTQYLYSLLAKDAGLEIPETKLFKTSKGEFFGARRFDRTELGRLHLHSLSGLLQVSPLNFSVGYEHFAKVAMALTNDITSQEAVFRIASFNVLARNQDDHSRKVSFLMDTHGTWSVAPAYDLTFHENRSGEHKMAVYGNGKPTLEDLEKFGVSIGLKRGKVRAILEQVRHSLSRFRKRANVLNLSKKILDRLSHAFLSLPR